MITTYTAPHVRLVHRGGAGIVWSFNFPGGTPNDVKVSADRYTIDVCGGTNVRSFFPGGAPAGPLMVFAGRNFTCVERYRNRKVSGQGSGVAGTAYPLNFNFLPHFADARLGVMPHTVQHYALDDPAPTYGNEDFHHMREFLQEEAEPERIAEALLARLAGAEADAQRAALGRVRGLLGEGGAGRRAAEIALDMAHGRPGADGSGGA